jgi:hypothetical protein
MSAVRNIASPVRGAILAGVASVLLTGPAEAQAAGAAAIADRLKHRAVYANPDASPTLTRAEARQIDHEIARKDPGRIKIAVVSGAEASDAGGVTALANTLDRRLNAPGTVLVNAGSRTWLVTSYSDTSAATATVQQAFDAHNSLVDSLREAVNGLASVDPDAGSPSSRSSPFGSPPSSTSLNISPLVVLIVVGVPFLAVGSVMGVRRWRAHAAAHETLEDDIADARDQLVALGDDIRDLDIDTSMPNANAAGKHDYENALVQYQRAERLLGEKVSVRRLARANDALAQGRQFMDVARRELGGEPTARSG